MNSKVCWICRTAKKNPKKSVLCLESLKKSLVNATWLAFHNHTGHMTITSDASNIGIGACLNQIQNGGVSTLCFFSPKLSEAERRTKNGGAICLIREIWPSLLIIGPRWCVKSDNQWFSDKKQRQLSFIGEYTSGTVHVAGRDNVVSNSFSRVASTRIARFGPEGHNFATKWQNNWMRC